MRHFFGPAAKGKPDERAAGSGPPREEVASQLAIGYARAECQHAINVASRLLTACLITRGRLDTNSAFYTCVFSAAYTTLGHEDPHTSRQSRARRIKVCSVVRDSQSRPFPS